LSRDANHDCQLDLVHWGHLSVFVFNPSLPARTT